MTSKERVQAAIAREPVDRVPMGFYAVDCDTIANVLGRPTLVRNKVETQIALWEGRRDEMAEAIKKDTVEFYRKIDCADIILPKEAPILPPKDQEVDPPKRIAPDRWEDRHGRIYQAAWGANEIQCIHNPRAREQTYRVEDFEKPLVAEPPDPSVFEAEDYLQQELGDERYVAGRAGAMTALTLLGGTENGLAMYALEPEVVLAASRQRTAAQNAQDAFMIRGDVPGVLMEQDMAGSNGPLVSPDMFREMCLPFMKERVQNVKSRVPQVIFHNCGRTIPLMEMFIETGIDCYQSLQTTAGMEVGFLK